MGAAMLILIFIFNATTPTWAAAPGPDGVADDEHVIVVTATATPDSAEDAVVATRVLDRAAIEASGAPTLDQLLEMQPGVQLLDSVRGTGVSLRGHDPAHTLVLVDGRRAIGRIGGSLDLRRFTTDRIDHVEIVTGPMSALYGADALGGVIHIVTRDATLPWFAEVTWTAGADIAPGTTDDRAVITRATGPVTGLDLLGLDLSAGFRTPVARGRVGLSLLGADGWDRTPSTAATTGDAQRVISPNGHFVFGPAANAVTVDLDGVIADGRGVDGTPTGATLDRLSRTESWGGSVGTSLDLAHKATLAMRIEGSVYRDQYRVDQRLSDALDSYQITREVLGRTVVQADGWVDDARRHQLLGGAEATVEDMKADRLSEGHAGRQRGALFAQYQWRASDAPKVGLLAGVRLDMDSLFGVFPAPRLALRVDPVRRVGIRVAGGLGFRAPDFKQLYLDFPNLSLGYRVVGNPDLRPERSAGGSLDVDLHPTDGLTVSLSVWHDALRDLIGTDIVQQGGANAPTVYGYVNVGRARVQGITASLGAGAGGPLSAQVSYTYTDADDLDGDRPLAGRAEHQGTASLSGTYAPWRMTTSASLNLLGPRPFYPSDDLTQAIVTPVTPLLDARMAWRVRPSIDLFAGVDNLLDAGLPDLDPTHPRRVYGGITARFTPPGEKE